MKKICLLFATFSFGRKGIMSFAFTFFFNKSCFLEFSIIYLQSYLKNKNCYSTMSAIFFLHFSFRFIFFSIRIQNI